MGPGVAQLTGEAFSAACPWAAGEGTCGALRVEEDSQVYPVDLCMAYAKLARASGVEIRENAPVEGILAKGGRAAGVEPADEPEIMAGRIALCAGAWSKPLADKI